MLHAFGVGEVPISISGDPGRPETLRHTIRDVGSVSGCPRGGAARHGPGRPRPVRHAGGRSARRTRRRRRLRRRAASGSPRSAPPSSRCVRRGVTTDGWRSSTAPVPPTTCSSPTTCATGPPTTTSTSRSPSTAPRAPGAATSDWSPRLIERATVDATRTLALVCGPEVMMRHSAGVPRRPWRTPRPGAAVHGAQHEVRRGSVRSLPAPGVLPVRRRPGAPVRRARTADVEGGAVTTPGAARTRPKLAVWKFASCDGCQLTLLNCEDELIPLAGEVEIAYFPEATRAVVEGPYDVSLVEGSITTPDELERIQQVREVSRRVITIGACATSGGIQALRNFADVAEFRSIVYAHPEYIATLAALDPDLRARAGRLRAARLPDRQAPAARGAGGRAPGPEAEDPEPQRLRGVQAARQRLRHRRARDTVPRSGHPGRLRCAVPELRPGLLRLLRPPGHPQHRLDRDPAARSTA